MVLCLFCISRDTITLDRMMRDAMFEMTMSNRLWIIGGFFMKFDQIWTIAWLLLVSIFDSRFWCINQCSLKWYNCIWFRWHWNRYSIANNFVYLVLLTFIKCRIYYLKYLNINLTTPSPKCGFLVSSEAVHDCLTMFTIKQFIMVKQHNSVVVWFGINIS